MVRFIFKINLKKAFFSGFISNIVFFDQMPISRIVKAKKVIFFALVFLIFGYGCVASKTTKKRRKPASLQENLESAKTCPQNISGEEKYCQTFTQQGGKSNRPIDILWVIDNSTSMCDNQTALAQNFASFINKFAGQSANVDFKMALISAPQLVKKVVYRNQGVGGRMYYIQYGATLTASGLKSSQQGFIDQFKTIITQIGCRGHSYFAESGLVMGLDFLEEKRSWIRKDAFLLVIHVSDQYDDGTLMQSQGDVKLVYGSYCGSTGYGGCQITGERDHQKVATHYIDTLTSHKGSKFLFKIFSVVNKEPQAPRFNSVAKLSDGKAYDILKDSFDTILQDFGSEVAKISSAFQLKYPAQVGTVEVFIDGVLAHQADWRYLEDQNAIRFEDGVFEGKAGESTIKVTYRTK